MPVLSVHHAQLPFRPAQATAIRHFYGVLLGLTDISPAASAIRRYVAGSQHIDLVPFDPPQPVAAQAHLAFEVLNLPELRGALLKAGLPLDESRPLHGHRRFYVHDPAGNRLEFIEPEPNGAWSV